MLIFIKMPKIKTLTKANFLGLLILFTFFIGYWPINKANAQAIGIGISPIRFEEIVNPGEILQKSITITNSSDTAKTIYPYLRDFSAAGETGIANLIVPGSEPGPYLSSWINISADGVVFASQEKKEIFFTIRVPDSAGPGGYYGALVFGTQPPKLSVEGEDKGAAMSVAQQTAALVLLRVKGEVNETANIREFSTDKQFYSMPFEVKFLTRLDNTGNVHIKPKGIILIKNLFGKEVGEIKFNDKGSNVLPASIRRFENVWPGTRGIGKYKASLIISYGTNVSDGGQGNQTMIFDTYFWILPWKLIIPGVLAVVFIIVLISLLLKFYKNKAVKNAMREMGLAQVKYFKKYYGPAFGLHITLIIAIFTLLIFLFGLIIYFIFFA